MKSHPWITNGGKDPMPALERFDIVPSENDLKNAFSKLKVLADVFIKRLSEMGV